ncbi:MAG TPA: ABC transporter permease subunit [Anaerolineales bacterium]|nr:ABC transporter permease subunit [Anaerolineales bacterium]
MANYLIRRFFQMIVVVLLSTVAIYVLLNVAPGGPISPCLATPRNCPGEAEIARLEAYLGLDKPLMLRYLAWILGDDWMGADWMYLGVTQYKMPVLTRTGTPMMQTNPDTGEKEPVTEKIRFWADPGPALLNPGLNAWVMGTPQGEKSVQIGNPADDGFVDQTLPLYVATSVRVKPPRGEQAPSEVVVTGDIMSQEGSLFVMEDIHGNRYAIQTTSETAFQFPEGEVDPRPTDGPWVNISWLTGAHGLLDKFSGFHGRGHGVLRWDFGLSWRSNQPVAELIQSRLSNTLMLTAASTLLSIVIGIPIGMYSATRQYSRTDYMVTTFAFFGSAMPVFWFGLMMILVFSHQFKQWDLPFFPAGGASLVREAPAGSLLQTLNAAPGSLIDRAVHLILPVVVLSLASLSQYSRFARGSMLEVLRQDYVRTARAKGLLERVVLYRHALRNALIPIVAVVVFDIAGIFGGATLTETIFSYPGMGRLYFDALGANDWPIVMAFLYISAILIVVATLARDVMFTIVDPRIRFK